MNTSLSHIWRDKRFNILLILLCFISYPLAAQKYATLQLTFTDVRSPSGNILVAIYTKDDQWTDKPYKQLKFSKEKLKNGTFSVEIDSLPRQIIAIALMDDEDSDFKMKYLLGLPREGFGMSSNPSFLKLKKPKFSEVSFELNAPVIHTAIKLNYLNPNKRIR